MTGILYQLTDNRILAIIPDVLEVTETSIKGLNHEMRGIDTSLAGIKVIEPFAVVGTPEDIKIILAEGGPEIGVEDIIDPAVLVDTRMQLPKTKDQEIDELKAGLQVAEADNLNTMLALTEVYELVLMGGGV